MLKWIAGGIVLFLVIVLLFLLLKIWLESRKECISPGEITGEILTEDLLKAVMRPLKHLAQYYEKRDVSQIDNCIEDVMLPEELLILGTNPREIFIGRERVKNLLWGDWKYWGKADIDADKAIFYRVGETIYFVVRGTVKLDIWKFVIPIKMTGIVREKDEKWYISKLQFMNDFNTNYIIFAWGVSMVLIVSMVILGLICLLHL